MRVGNEFKQWNTGKALMFDDSFEHEVFHNGTDPRVVLLMDIFDSSPLMHFAEKWFNYKIVLQ